VEFDWDDAKDEATRRLRGFGFDYAIRIFAGPVIEWVDDRMDYSEVRIRAVGAVGTDVLHVVYTPRGTVLRIISARRANRKERQRWQSRA
jgi:uncharacterized DUF497 family protein